MYFRKTPSIPGLESDLDSDSDLAYAKHYGPLFFVGLDISLQCNGAEECTVGDEGIWGEFFFFLWQNGKQRKKHSAYECSHDSGKPIAAAAIWYPGGELVCGWVRCTENGKVERWEETWLVKT